MSGKGDQPADPPIAAGDVEAAGALLLEAIGSACDREAGLREQIEAGLGAVLALFTAKPELVPLFTEQLADEEARSRRRRIFEDCSALLRAAAEDATGTAERPPLVEPFLLHAVRFEVFRVWRKGDADLLAECLPELRDFILAYYRESLPPAPR